MKEINVRMELWKKAHELEAKAFESGEYAEMGVAGLEKERLAELLFQNDKKAAAIDSPITQVISAVSPSVGLEGVGRD